MVEPLQERHAYSDRAPDDSLKLRRSGMALAGA